VTGPGPVGRTGAPARDALRRRLCVALDSPTEAEALASARALAGRTGWVKVGLQLFTAAGGGVVRKLTAQGFDVFLDLKLHDIPNTVAAAAVEASRHGAAMINVHASGGLRMMRAAAEALAREARQAAKNRPLLVAVTALTSLDEEDLADIGLLGPAGETVIRLAALAQRAGCDGVVCSPREISLVRARCGEEFTIVTPGIRPAAAAPSGGAAGGPVATPRSSAIPPATSPATSPARLPVSPPATLPAPPPTPDDQRRVATAAEAMAWGADLVVIGRPVTAAPDPAAAVDALLDEIIKETLRAPEGAPPRP